MIAIRHPDGFVRGRIVIFPGDTAELVTRAIHRVRRGEVGVVGRMQGRSLAVEVSVELCGGQTCLGFHRVADRYIGRRTFLGPEEIDALDRGLSLIEHEDERRTL